MIVTALVMLLTGWVLLFMQVLQILPANLLLSFLAYILTIAGLVTGMIGLVGVWRR